MQMEEAPGLPTKTTSSSSSITAMGWGVSIVILLLLWQAKSLQPVLTWIGIIVALGLLLRYYPTIEDQFKKVLGK